MLASEYRAMISFVRSTPKSRGPLSSRRPRMWAESLRQQWGQTILSLFWGVDIDSPIGEGEKPYVYRVVHPVLGAMAPTIDRKSRGASDPLAVVTCAPNRGDNCPPEEYSRGRKLHILSPEGERIDRKEAIDRQEPGLRDAVRALFARTKATAKRGH